jgi:choline dehydrogenase-like flavoprotein
VSTLGGKEFSVRARTYVLAVGGIEVPRLLLLSNRTHKDGLGNQHDLVGRFFMEHPHFWSGIFYPTDPEAFRKTALYNEIHSVNRVPVVGKLALNQEVVRKERLLSQNIQLIPRFLDAPGANGSTKGVDSARAMVKALKGENVDNLGGHVQNVISDVGSVLLAGARKVHGKIAGRPQVPAFYFANMMEQVPNPESRVTLGRQRDSLGQNRLQLDWKITAQDIQSAVRTQELIGGAMERAGLGRFDQQLRGEAPPSNTEGGYHHMGTTRMAEDSKSGVVDPQCRVHGVGNLYIAGPSVFPTGGYANPVLTIIALTLRLADRLKTQMR